MFMSINRRSLLQAAAASAAASGISFLPGASMAAARVARPAKLTVGVQDLRTILEPMHPQSAAVVSYRVQENIFDGLLTLNYLDNFKVVPALAESFRQIDQTTYEFSIRRNVKFHDGSELTADDVVFSFGPTRLLDEKAPGHEMKNQFLPSLKGVEKIDDFTVHLTTVSADPVFLKRLASWGGQIICKAAYEKAGSFEEWAKRPVGTGPFRVLETSDDRFIKLAAHDTYWDGVPSVGEIDFVKVAELSARVAGLLAGDYEIVTDVTPDQIAAIQGQSGYTVVGGEVAVFRSVNIDTHNPQLADPRLRQAMSLAIDRKSIVDALWARRVEVPNGMQLPSFGSLYNSSRPALAYDPKKARQLVKQSGYKGEPIPYRMLQGYYTNELVTAQALVAMWQVVGINVRIEIKENWDQVYQKPGTGLNNDSCPMLYPDPLSTLWRCYGSASSYQSFEKSWANPEFNSLGKVLESNPDDAERRKAFQRMLDITENDDPPSILLHTMAYLYGIRKNIEWKPYPSAPMDFRPDNLKFTA